MENKKKSLTQLSTFIACSISIFLSLQFPFLHAQSLIQSVRGKVIDHDSRSPLQGANIVVLKSESNLSASTDVYGEFRIESVPIGRISLVISHSGYEEKVVPNILVTAGKEVILDIYMREAFINLKEVVLSSTKKKSRIANEMAQVSVRGVTVEETKRYAGSFNDPARMVSGYAGVSVNSDDADNSIIVRGNSSKGILWQLEGIEIPNPNHFASEGATGGPINTLNSKMLDNSDFYTAAFPPEYGNALSGVFDMRLRKGNNEQKEYSFSAGAVGLEANIEGPFKKGGGSSYLLNYRYSTLSLLSNLGLVDFDGIPKYQDISFKVNIPTKSLGTFSIFGLGGKSNITEREFAEEDETKLLEKGDFQADLGIVGITQYLTFNKTTYLQNSVSISQNGSGFLGYEPNEQNELIQLEDVQLDKKTIKATSTLNHKFNARLNLRTGLIYTHHYFDFYDRSFDEVLNKFVTDQDVNGDAGHYQGFISFKYRPSQKISFVTGFHAHGTTLKDNLSIEPRASLRWQFYPRQALSAGFGIHGKMESLPNYYSIITAQDGTVLSPNKNISFSKARHYVIGYESKLSTNLFFKMEAYYQQLYNIPIENKENSSYSLINQIDGFTDRALVNKGTGKNIGLELTLERYFVGNYYFLATASVYDSKYKAMDRIKRNTRFNGNYAGNLLFGKEFELVTKNVKKKVIGVNAKISLLGAQRYTPVNLEESIRRGETIYYENLAFSKRSDDVFIANLAITYRIDRKKISQEFKFDIQNVTNNAAKLRQYYNDNTKKIKHNSQLPLFPVVMYSVSF